MHWISVRYYEMGDMYIFFVNCLIIVFWKFLLYLVYYYRGKIEFYDKIDNFFLYILIEGCFFGFICSCGLLIITKKRTQLVGACLIMAASSG